MIHGFLALFCIIGINHGAVDAQWQQSGFWTRAKTTSDLGVLRQTEVPMEFERIIPKKITEPSFFPLCGNGRLDTKEDYVRLHGPDFQGVKMRLPKRAFGDARNLKGLDWDAIHETLMISDEVCDDGNRDDFDGCSADCMSFDLLTSSCEIAVKTPLQYEDAIPHPETGDVIISALDGIYLMQETRPGDTHQTFTLLHGKTFPVKSVYYSAGGLLLYSSQEQSVWRLNTLQGSLSLMLNLSNVLKPWDSPAEEGLGGILIFRDKSTMFVIDAETNIAIAQCVFSNAFDNSCFFQEKTRNKVWFICYKKSISYIVIPNSGQCSETINSDLNDYQGPSIWSDVMNLLSKNMILDLDPVQNFVFETTPALLDQSNNVFKLNPTFVRGYYFSGLIVEFFLNFPRTVFESTSYSEYIRVVGNELFSLMITPDKSKQTCGPKPCMFDLPVGYDSIGTSPYSHAIDTTWMDVLQDLINAEILRLRDVGVDNLGALRFFNYSANYYNLVQSFHDKYQASVSYQRTRKILFNPKSKNLLVVRETSLYEISRSGVQLHVGNGKCLPSYIAICPVCFWAESGKACKPCSMRNESSVACNLSCSLNCFPAPAVQNRRLLSLSQSGDVAFAVGMVNRNASIDLEQGKLRTVWPSALFTFLDRMSILVVLKSSNVQLTIETVSTQLRGIPGFTVIVPPYAIDNVNGSVEIVFVFDGVDTTKLNLLWPPDSIRKGERNTTVTLRTSNDPRIDMQLVKQKLSENPDLRLLTNPYVRFNGPIATVDPDTSNGDSNSMVIAIVIVVIFVGCCAAVYLFSKSKKKKSLGAKLDYSHFSTVRINL